MERRTNKKAILWLSGGHVINDAYMGFLNPIMPFISAKIGISMAIATLIMSLSHVFSSFLQPVFGVFADNIIKRVFVFWGLILSTVFIPVAINADNPYTLTLFIVIGSLGGSLFHPQATGFIVRFSKEDFSRNMAFFIAAGTVGFAIGPVISGLVTEHLGLEVMPYSSIIGVGFALLVFKFVPKISNVDKPPEHKEIGKSLKAVLSNKTMQILIAISIMKSVITNSNAILLPFLWKNMGYSAGVIGGVLFLFVIAGAIGSLVSPRLEKVLGTKNIFYISMILTLPMMWGFLYFLKINPIISLVIFVATGFVTMLAMPVTMVLAQRTLPEYKSIVSGFIQGFSWGIAAIFMSVVGFVADSFGIVKVLALIAIAPALFSILVKKLPD